MPSSDNGRPTRGGVPNGARLEALGEAVERKEHPDRPERPGRVRRSRGKRRGRKYVIGGVVALVVVVAIVGGGGLYGYYLFSKIHKVKNSAEVAAVSGQPFNILEIGSDSRSGLTGVAAAQTGAATATGDSHSDVIKIMHVDPAAGTITVLSIPRDTMAQMVPAYKYSQKFDRFNATFYTGNPSLLTQTIEANLGIPINHTIVVSFAGLINAADAVGGVRMFFPYPAKDPMSGLYVPHAGCRIITNTQALALARSRHYYWYEPSIPGNVGGWNYDVTSDFGRIYRQNEFIKALLAKAKHLYNPLTLSSFLSKIPQGVTLDSNFSFSELTGLAIKFHNINPAGLATYTLPTTPGPGGALGDVLYIQEPTTEQLLTKIFGSQLERPTSPPPNANGVPQMPPVITIPKTVAAKTAAGTTPAKKSTGTTVQHTAPPVTTTTIEGDQWFDPVPC